MDTGKSVHLDTNLFVTDGNFKPLTVECLMYSYSDCDLPIHGWCVCVVFVYFYFWWFYSSMRFLSRHNFNKLWFVEIYLRLYIIKWNLCELKKCVSICFFLRVDWSLKIVQRSTLYSLLNLIKYNKVFMVIWNHIKFYY